MAPHLCAEDLQAARGLIAVVVAVVVAVAAASRSVSINGSSTSLGDERAGSDPLRSKNGVSGFRV